MSYCSDCGSKVESGESFCPNCGQQQVDVTPVGARRPPGGRSKAWLFILIPLMLVAVVVGVMVVGQQAVEVDIQGIYVNEDFLVPGMRHYIEVRRGGELHYWKEGMGVITPSIPGRWQIENDEIRLGVPAKSQKSIIQCLFLKLNCVTNWPKIGFLQCRQA